MVHVTELSEQSVKSCTSIYSFYLLEDSEKLVEKG